MTMQPLRRTPPPPENWLYPTVDFAFDAALPIRQKCASFIADLCEQLHLPTRCLYTAVTYANRFLQVQPQSSYEPLRVCQACVLLACKNEDKSCLTADICFCTARLLETSEYFTASQVLEYCREQIIDYENILLCTFGFVLNVRQPYCLIEEWVAEFGGSGELERMASTLATESILLTPFCIKYSANVIACFCIQLIVESKRAGAMDERWLCNADPSFTLAKFHELVKELSALWMAYPYQCKKFDGHHLLTGELLFERMPLATTEVERRVDSVANGEADAAKALAPPDQLARKPVAAELGKNGSTSMSSDGLFPNKRVHDSSIDGNQSTKRMCAEQSS